VPSLSILAEPPVALVDANVDAKHGTREVAEAYLDYLYSRRRARNSRRSTTTARRTRTPIRRTAERFPKLELVTIDDPIFGGWAKAQPEHFDDGGIFDQIYGANGSSSHGRSFSAGGAPSVSPASG
jgi:sulfate/thiosulfate transport system substrate-binding protein